MFTGLLGKGSKPSRGPPALPECGCRHNTNPWCSVDHQGDECSPNRDASEKVCRAIDRIDDPFTRGSSFTVLFPGGAKLFAENRVVGSRSRESLPNDVFNFPIRVRDRRRVGFCGHFQVGGSKPAHRHEVGVCSERPREGEIISEVECHNFRLRHGIERRDESLNRVEACCTVRTKFTRNNGFDHGAVVVAVVAPARA